MPRITADQEYELVPIDAIRPHPDNPNRGNVDAIRESIRISGFYGACTVQRSTGYILAGNHRYQAAVAEGLTHVPVVWKDYDPVEAIRVMLADNEIARLAVTDDDAVEELLEQLGSLEGTGFDFARLEAAEAEAEALEEALAAEEDRLAGEAESDGTDDIPEGLGGTQYGVVILVEGEDEQELVYNEMRSRGFKCRVVSV